MTHTHTYVYTVYIVIVLRYQVEMSRKSLITYHNFLSSHWRKCASIDGIVRPSHGCNCSFFYLCLEFYAFSAEQTQPGAGWWKATVDGAALLVLTLTVFAVSIKCHDTHLWVDPNPNGLTESRKLLAQVCVATVGESKKAHYLFSPVARL